MIKAKTISDLGEVDSSPPTKWLRFRLLMEYTDLDQGCTDFDQAIKYYAASSRRMAFSCPFALA
jgi:hypothetical protein